MESGLLQVYAAGVNARRVFVSYVDHPVIEELPTCPEQARMCPVRTQAIEAHAQQVASIQRCVIARIAAIGGDSVESFVVGNATSARLTLEQARDIASLTEVRSITDAERVDFPF